MDDHSLVAEIAGIELRLQRFGGGGALSAYIDVLGRILAADEGFAFTQTTAYLVERCAEVAVWCGYSPPAAKMLLALQLALEQVGNRHAADLIAVKRLHLAVSAGDRAGIQAALESLAVTIGDFYRIDFSPAGLVRFEAQCAWPVADARERRCFFASFLLEAGRLLAWLGRFKPALSALQLSLVHAGDPNIPLNLANAVRQELASVLLSCGDLAGARRHLQEARSTTEVADQLGLRTRQAELLGHAALLAGDLAGARRAYEACRQLCEQHGLWHGAQRVALNLAHLLIVLNRTLEAEQVLAAARSQGMPVSPELEQRLDWFGALVRARRTAGLSGPAVAPSNASLWEPTLDDEAARTDDLPEYRPLGQLSASLLERLGDYTLEFYGVLDRRQFARADALLAQIRAVYDASDSPLIACRVALLAALPLYFRGEYREAAAQLEPVYARLQGMGLLHDQWLVGSVRLWCQMRLGEPCEDLRSQTRDLLAALGAGLDDADRTLFELNKWDEAELAFKAAIEQLQAARLDASRAPWLSRLSQAWRWRNQLDMLVRTLDEHRARLWSAPGTKARAWWWRVLSSRRRERSVSCLVLPDRVLVVREGWLQLDFDLLPVTRLRLRELVRAWHTGMADPQPDETVARCAEELGRHLRVADWLSAGAVTHLRIVADDVLHGFPFAALKVDDRFLADRVAVSFDTTHVPRVEPARMSRPARAFIADVGLGLDGHEPLPHARVEADCVGSLLRAAGLRVERLSDADATRTAMMEALSATELAHVACHGVFSRNGLTATGMLLPPGGPEGLLDLRRIAAMPLQDLRHITLASCWSADNYLLPGRAVVSLPQALRHAGAASVLSCLWKVDDNASRVFSARYYALCATLAPPHALRQTQSEFLHGTLLVGGVRATDPYFWAGFVAHCAPRAGRRALLGR